MVDMEADNLRKKGTGKTGLALVAIAIGIVALIALAVYAFTIPGVFESVVKVALFIVVAIAVIAIIAYGAIMLISIPMYIAKGEQTQTSGNYSLDDIKPVENSSSDDPKND